MIGILRRIWFRLATGTIAAAGLAVALWQIDKHYAIGKWLFWPYLAIWVAIGVWVLACLSAGHVIVRRVVRVVMPLREHLFFAFTVGVLAFASGMFLLGLVHALRPVTFFAWPMAMIAVGIVPLVRFCRRAWRHLRRARARPALARPSPVTYALLLFGAMGVLALYLNALTPTNLAYDSRWYHLGIAEHYANAHSIARFPEGWFAGALPQLTSLLYCWGFLFPSKELFMHVEMAAHLEFVMILATLVGLPLLVRRLVGAGRVSMAWTAFFLFPGIFVYDSMPGVAADHVLAFWGVPLYLAALRFWRSWQPRDAGLVAAAAAGALLTKYQAIYMLLPLAAGLSARALFLVWRRRTPRAALAPVLIAAGMFALLTAPHWLKNLIWYGDPAYPMLHNTLHVRPWNPDVDLEATMQAGGFQTTGPLLHRVRVSAESMATFSFDANDWDFHKGWPTFGFLFTLMLPFVVLLKKAWRLRALTAACMAGVFVWYWTFHQERYLQALTPLMAAVVAGVIWRMWGKGIVARIAMVSLIALQVVWGGDHYALPTQGMIWTQPLKKTLDLFGGAYQGQFEERFHVPSDIGFASKGLPRGSRILVHEQHLRLGSDVPLASDSRGSQGAFSYRRMRSAREMWDTLRAMGVTHVIWPSAPMGLETFSDEAVFYGFVRRYTSPRGTFQGSVNVMVLGELSATPPPEQPFGPVALEGCYVAHRTTLPEVEVKIWTATPSVTDAQKAANQKDAEFILIEAGCRGQYPSVSGYELVTTHKGWETWARRR